MQLRPYQLFVATTISAMVGFYSCLLLMDSKANSEESHRVFNYLTENSVTPDLISRFNSINGDYPPSRNKLAALLLDAEKQVTARPDN